MVNYEIVVSYWLVFCVAMLKIGVKKIGTEDNHSFPFRGFRG